MKDGKIMQIGTGEEILTNPANEFVSEFVEDVDRSKVLTAQNIMIKPITTNIDIDGPKVALRRMDVEKVSMLLAINRQRRLLGTISADAKQHSLVDYIDKDIRTVSKDTLLEDILPLIYDSAAPIAVVENERLIGVLIKGRIIEALTKQGIVIEE